MAAAKYNLTEDDYAQFKAAFDHMDKDHSGTLEEEEVRQALEWLKLDAKPEAVKRHIAEVDTNKNGKIDLDEFMIVARNCREDSAGFGKVVATAKKKMVEVKGAGGGTHSFAEEEMAAFAEHFNQVLGRDPDLQHLMPINPAGYDLCEKVADGLLLAKFINVAVPDTIDERALNKGKLSRFQINENLNLVVSAAKSIGVQTVNIGASELSDGAHHPHLVLGIVWQLVKLQLLGSIDLKNHPELIRLLEEGEELSDLLKLPPDQLLLRWFNYHLKRAGHDKRVTNFGPDVKDGVAYTVLLNQIAPQTCSRAPLDEGDLHKRAGMVLDNAKRLNVATFIQPQDIVKGNPKLNLAFTAAIFNQCPGLEQLTQEELEKAGLMEDDFGDSREERAFRMWINSLGIDELYINSLFEDCKDGLALLRVIDKVEPGIVSWKQVEMKPNNKFKKVANCNYVVVLGKQMKFSLVGIGGTDIVDGNKKLLLALVWQLMRYHTLKFLAAVRANHFQGSKEVSEDQIIEWANHHVKTSGRNSHMSNFKDPSLATCVFFLDLIRSIEPRIINEEFVKEGKTPEDALLNAKYAISVARKLGAVVFCLPEDLVEVKPKMVLTFVASVMSLAK